MGLFASAASPTACPTQSLRFLDSQLSVDRYLDMAQRRLTLVSVRLFNVLDGIAAMPLRSSKLPEHRLLRISIQRCITPFGQRIVPRQLGRSAMHLTIWCYTSPASASSFSTTFRYDWQLSNATFMLSSESPGHQHHASLVAHAPDMGIAAHINAIAPSALSSGEIDVLSPRRLV